MSQRALLLMGSIYMVLFSTAQLLFAGGGIGEMCGNAAWDTENECLREGPFRNCVGSECGDACGCDWNAAQQEEDCDTPAEQQCFDSCVAAADAWQEKNSGEYGFCEE